MFHLFTDVHTREFTGVKAKPSKLRLCNSACWEMYRVGGNNTHTHTAQSDQGRSRDLRDNQDATYLTHTHTHKEKRGPTECEQVDGFTRWQLFCSTVMHRETHPHTPFTFTHRCSRRTKTHTHTHWAFVLNNTNHLCQSRLHFPIRSYSISARWDWGSDPLQNWMWFTIKKNLFMARFLRKSSWKWRIWDTKALQKDKAIKAD